MEKPNGKVVQLDAYRKKSEALIEKVPHGYWQDMKDGFKEEFDKPEVRERFPELNATLLGVILNDCLIALQDDTSTSDADETVNVTKEAENLSDKDISAKILEARLTIRAETANRILAYVESLYHRLGSPRAKI